MNEKQVFLETRVVGRVGLFFLSVDFAFQANSRFEKRARSKAKSFAFYFLRFTSKIPHVRSLLPVATFRQKIPPAFSGWDVFYEMVGRVGLEPTKAKPKDLQSSPFDHSGTDPKRKKFLSFQFVRRNFHLSTFETKNSSKT